jgi:hypothetical protein
LTWRHGRSTPISGHALDERRRLDLESGEKVLERIVVLPAVQQRLGVIVLENGLGSVMVPFLCHL